MKVKFKEYCLFFEFDAVVVLSSHVLQGGSAINVMELLSFIDDSSDVRAFEEGYLSDHFFVSLLLSRQIVVRHLSYCFKTIGKSDLL